MNEKIIFLALRHTVKPFKMALILRGKYHDRQKMLLLRI